MCSGKIPLLRPTAAEQLPCTLKELKYVYHAGGVWWRPFLSQALPAVFVRLLLEFNKKPVFDAPVELIDSARLRDCSLTPGRWRLERRAVAPRTRLGERFQARP